jgi:hypothetical protein
MRRRPLAWASLRLSSRAELVAYAIDRGLISTGE